MEESGYSHNTSLGTIARDERRCWLLYHSVDTKQLSNKKELFEMKQLFDLVGVK